MASEIKWKPNPHIWRKFKQAETNMLRLLGFTRRSPGYLDGRRWNGNSTERKHRRRVRYWSRQMLKWSERLF